jgi:mRNA-degrading endonuclease RelE of RelBE toxin-antitoxin system
LTKHAEKQLRKLLQQVWSKLLILETFPEKGELLAGSEEALRSFHFTVKGSGQFRAIYTIEDEHVCLIAFIGPRENFYARFVRFREGS